MVPALPDHNSITILAISQGNLLHLPACKTRLLRFFVLNYVAHAFTIWARPADATSEKLFAIVLALFFPVSGLGRAIDAAMSRVTLVVAFGKVCLVIGHDKNTRADASSTCFALNDLHWENATLRGTLYAPSPFQKFFRLNRRVYCQHSSEMRMFARRVSKQHESQRGNLCYCARRLQ
jgi:hypothetical protein